MLDPFVFRSDSPRMRCRPILVLDPLTLFLNLSQTCHLLNKTILDLGVSYLLRYRHYRAGGAYDRRNAPFSTFCRNARDTSWTQYQ